MYARTSFRGAKREKIGQKGVFLVILTNFGKDIMDKLRTTHSKMRIWGLFSYLKNTCLGCILWVLLRGWYPAWNTSAPLDFNPPHDMYENMPKTPIPFFNSLPPPHPSAVNWFQRKIYSNVDGNWENSLYFLTWCYALICRGMQETVLQKHMPP